MVVRFVRFVVIVVALCLREGVAVTQQDEAVVAGAEGQILDDLGSLPLLPVVENKGDLVEALLCCCMLRFGMVRYGIP